MKALRFSNLNNLPKKKVYFALFTRNGVVGEKIWKYHKFHLMSLAHCHNTLNSVLQWNFFFLWLHFHPLQMQTTKHTKHTKTSESLRLHFSLTKNCQFSQLSILNNSQRRRLLYVWMINICSNLEQNHLSENDE